jgi:hypothetical protein
MPLRAVEAGAFNRVPVVLGTNRNEGSIFIPMFVLIVPGLQVPPRVQDVPAIVEHAFDMYPSAVVRAATLKVLGGSRAQILLAYGVEYGAVGLIAGVAGVALGYAAAWPVVVLVFEADWSVDWGGVAALLGGASGLAFIGGLLAAMQALSKRPAPVLRTE